MRPVLLGGATLLLLFDAGRVYAQRPPVRSLLELRTDRVVMQQWDLSCGAAALATVLTYDLDHSVPEREVALAMLRNLPPDRVRERGGFSLLDMKRYAESLGFIGQGFGDMSLEELAELAPAIVPARLDGYDHFVVFRGLAAGRVLLADPSFGNRTTSVAEFMEHWDRIAFIVRRP